MSRYQEAIDKFLRLYKLCQTPGWETLVDWQDQPEPTVFHVIDKESQHLILVTTLEQAEELQERHLREPEFAVQTAYDVGWETWEPASFTLLEAQVRDNLEAIPAEEDVPVFERKPYPTLRRVYRRNQLDDREPFS